MKKFKYFGMFLFACAVSLVAADAFALVSTTNLNTTAFGYVLYNTIQGILNGPVGMVTGVGALLVGGAAAMTQRIMAAIPALIGGIVIIKGDDMIKSLGMMF